MATQDELLAEYRALRCPEGARPEISLDDNEVGCWTQAGERVQPLPPASLSPAGLGLIGWSAVISAGLVLVALASDRWGG